MLNENKVKMMTKIAIYEKNEGKTMLKTAKYFKGDFIAFGILKTIITTTIAFVIIVLLYVLCNAEGLMNQINSMDYMALGRKVAVYYVLMLIIFTAIAAAVYNYKYEHC